MVQQEWEAGEGLLADTHSAAVDSQAEGLWCHQHMRQSKPYHVHVEQILAQVTRSGQRRTRADGPTQAGLAWG